MKQSPYFPEQGTHMKSHLGRLGTHISNSISTVKVDYLHTHCNRNLEFFIILCGDRTRTDLNLLSRLEDGVGWISQKDYHEYLFKLMFYNVHLFLMMSFKWTFRAGCFSSMNPQRDAILDLFTKIRGTIISHLCQQAESRKCKSLWQQRAGSSFPL